MELNKIKQDVALERKHLASVIDEAIHVARQKVDAVEISVNKSTGINVSTLQGEVENVEFNNDGALGITVYQDQRKGHASTNDLSPQAIEETINMAINIMRYTSPDPFSGLGDVDMMAFDSPDLDLFHPSNLDVEYAIQQAAGAEKIALAHPKITNSDGSHFSSSYGIHVYGNSEGLLQSYCGSSHSLSCSVIAEQDGCMERQHAYTYSRELNALKSAEWVGLQATERAVAHLGARQIKTMQVPVLFSAEMAVGLIRHLVGAISGSAVYKKSTFLLDSIDKQIFPTWLTIEEHPHILKGIGSAPFDAEGTKTIDRHIIESGLLKTYLLSHYSARKLSDVMKLSPLHHLKSTGHAGGIYNWIVKTTQPSDNFDAILKTMDKGLIVTSLMGQGINLVTGDYSRGASGFWVEHGQIQYPVNEITIAGNLKDMYKQIITVGNDIETRSNIKTGSILIENMSIAGK